MLRELLDDHQTGMSEFQDDYFVTSRAGGTQYGQYKQALRELYKRFRGLREITCDIEKLQVEIEEQEFIKDNSEEDEFKRKYAAIEFKRKTMQMEESERVLKDTEREFKRFYQQAAYLKQEIGELTDEKRAALDKDMWMFKLKEMVCIDWITKGSIGTNTFEFLHACPKDMKMQLLDSVKDQKSLLEWYENKEEYIIPDEFKNISLPDFKNNTLLLDF